MARWRAARRPWRESRARRTGDACDHRGATGVALPGRRVVGGQLRARHDAGSAAGAARVSPCGSRDHGDRDGDLCRAELLAGAGDGHAVHVRRSLAWIAGVDATARIRDAGPGRRSRRDRMGGSLATRRAAAAGALVAGRGRCVPLCPPIAAGRGRRPACAGGLRARPDPRGSGARARVAQCSDSVSRAVRPDAARCDRRLGVRGTGLRLARLGAHHALGDRGA